MSSPSHEPGDPIWLVSGPTASGKSELALELAERNGLEIVSMDSMAVYRRMDIGTAKPSAGDRARVPHHLVDIVEPHEEFDTARWCQAAALAMEDIRNRGRKPLFVGGTPLYLMAFFKGLMDTPPADAGLRAALAERERAEPGALHEELSRKDPEAAARIHRHDERRLVRALEVIAVTGRKISEQQDHFDNPKWLRPCRIVALNRSREDLHERVKVRTRAMLAAGLVEEVRAILQAGGFSRTAGAAIGYAECVDWLRGRYKDETELRNIIRRNTHRLIRRQLTWLRRLREVQWLPPAATAANLHAALAGAEA